MITLKVPLKFFQLIFPTQIKQDKIDIIFIEKIILLVSLNIN